MIYHGVVPFSIEDIRVEAQARFMRAGPVVGVGILDGFDATLIFLLREDTVDVKEAIRTWAATRGVRVEFEVTGPIKPSARSRG